MKMIRKQTAKKIPGQRQTLQRQAIHDYLREHNTHPTADQIYQDLRKRFPNLSLATVYNTLNLLVSAGEVSPVGDIGDHALRYDGNTNSHINLVCSKCFKIVDILYCQLDQIDRHIQTSSGFSIIGAQFLYYGICPDCQTHSEFTHKEN